MNNTNNKHMEWIGKTPANWRFERGKYLFVQRSSRGNAISLQLLSPTQKHGVIPQSLYEELTGMNAVKLNEDTDLSCLKTIHKGDYCISLRSFQGGFEYCQYEGVVSPAYQVFYPIVPVCDGFYKYLFKDKCFIDKMNSYTMTLRDGKNIAFSDFGNTYIPIPPIDEQHRIAEFLDTQCSGLDGLILDIREQITILEQYKRSVITETVTKGLNPDVETKESGIEWVEMIPAHWPVHPVYTYFGERKNKNRFGTEDNLLSLSYGKVIRKDINTSDGLLPESFNTYNIVEAGDIIIRPTDLQNDKRSLRTGLVKEHGIITSAYIDLFPIKKVDSRFFHYLLHAYDVMKVFYNMGNGVRQGLNYSEFSRLMVFEPTYDEQVAIADYLDGKITEIDSIIEQKKAQLSVLEAYKKSLIFEYVTGKKEVPVPITAVMVDPNVILLGKLPKLLSKQKGKIYNQKVLYLLNTYLGLNLDIQYYRYKHGPYDIMLDSYIDTLVENGWCVKTVNNGAENLDIGPNYGAFEEKCGSCFSEYNTEINSLIQFVQPMKRSQIERVATLFAVWNDMILDGNSTPTDAEIVSEVMSGWTENKANFAYDTWVGTLNKMRTNGIVPKGQGLHTLPREC